MFERESLFLERRLLRSRALAASASDISARGVHRKMAAEYEMKIAALGAASPTVQPMLRIAAIDCAAG